MIATTAPASTTPARRTLATNAPSFGTTLQSEWTKLRTIRSTWIMAGMAIGLSIAFSLLTALVVGLTYDSWNTSGQQEFDPILTPMSGLLFGLVLLTVLSVTAVTSEYSSRMIRTTLIGNPRRMRVFAAKAILVGGLGLAISAITIPSLILLSQPIYGHYGLETASITDSAAVRLILVNVFGQGLIYTLIPFSIAWLLRSTASAITVAIGFNFLPWMLASIVPIWMQHNLLRYLPDPAANSLSGLNDSGAATYLSQTPALLLIPIWLIVALTAAALTLNRRDV